eukprot:CAMPEP_0204190666 /NCGR_PEP_ID=MMETSP0361-20130328/59492_1 /ASSEMBLY_ACC=CAM_ASM_000343 /TAXON_ID=268821 /ORGANISM="Scrippsiella Hangoei, Strain SHTV-5" /LENGTH=121 /DNA_ID=CAMNT_0051151515 /DNA_START=112 /DNA_END=473 /DNA_ORIENTATION=+
MSETSQAESVAKGQQGAIPSRTFCCCRPSSPPRHAITVKRREDASRKRRGPRTPGRTNGELTMLAFVAEPNTTRYKGCLRRTDSIHSYGHEHPANAAASSADVKFHVQGRGVAAARRGCSA